MNLLLPRSDRRRFFLLSDFQSNALHGDINKTLKTLLSPFFLTSTAAKPLNNAAVPPPHLPLRKRISLKTLPQASSYPSPETQTPQIVAAGLLLSLSSDKNPSKRRRRPLLIPLRKRKSTQNVAGGFLLSLSSDKNPSKRRRRARREQRSVSATFILILF